MQELLLAKSSKGRIKLYFATLMSESSISKGCCHFHLPDDVQFKYELILSSYICVTFVIS